MSRNAHCCLCGARRRPTQAPVESFCGPEGPSIRIGEHRPLREGRWETDPQLIVRVSIFRNGGTAPGQTHICDDCIVVGLQHAKEFIASSLAALSAEAA